jgi:ABC-type transport system involved in multi-copper enzyme maturation permease subunit
VTGSWRRILHLARREWLEQVRQPAMLASIGTLFVAISGLVSLALILLNRIAGDPVLIAQLSQWTPALGIDGDPIPPLVTTVVSIANWLIFTQFLGITAVLAGHAILHDRQVGTLPFLLLAPVRRIELVAGKVFGAIGPSLLLYLVVSGAAGITAAALPVTTPLADRLPPSPAWGIAFLVGGPMWACAVSTVCTLISAATRDVRTAQQVVWLLMFFATFFCGFLLAALLPRGAGVELGVAGLGAVAFGAALVVGSQVISRDLGR